MTLSDQLAQTFATNFEVYYRTHVAHVNITGRNFYNDHRLLNKIYVQLQEDIDLLAEFLRTIGEAMPNNLAAVQQLAATSDTTVEGQALTMLQGVLDDLNILVDDYLDLITLAEIDNHPEIADFAQGRIQTLKKYIWMLTSTLDDRSED